MTSTGHVGPLTLRKGMNMKVLFSGKEIEVSYVDRGADTVVFSFSGYRSHEQDQPRYGYAFLEKCGVNAVFFVARKDHWWQSPEMEPAISAAMDATRGGSVPTHGVGGRARSLRRSAARGRW